MAAAGNVRYRGILRRIPGIETTEPQHTDGGQSTSGSRPTPTPAGRGDSAPPPGSGTTAPSVSNPPSDEEPLLSKEEQLLRALDRHGGRVKQQQLVEELGWSDSKTSKVVSDLRESGQIETFRLGQENVVDRTTRTEEQT